MKKLRKVGETQFKDIKKSCEKVAIVYQRCSKEEDSYIFKISSFAPGLDAPVFCFIIFKSI